MRRILHPTRIQRIAFSPHADPLTQRATRAPRLGRVALAVVGLALNGCVPRGNPGDLAPTLTLEQAVGGQVAMQNGIVVPSFELQPRSRLDLGGDWRVQRTALDANLSLTPRDDALPMIEEAAGGRHEPEFDDAAWAREAVPGTLNPPPDGPETGGWYRRAFVGPAGWAGRSVTLKFAAANYIADVWLNGVWLGYHEGGSTPFAFDATDAFVAGGRNVLAARVDNPAWGTRNDIVPWGLADWWNFGGLVRPVWLEASDSVLVPRVDVVPHLDGADVSVVIENRGDTRRAVEATIEILPTRIEKEALLDPDPRALVASTIPLVRERLEAVTLEPRSVVRQDASFVLADADLWELGSPALYAVRVVLGDVDAASTQEGTVDEFLDTFGLRRVAVDAAWPAVTLNGRPVVLPGVALHDQRVDRATGGEPARGHLPTSPEVLGQLERARDIGARLVRTGHAPANPELLRLADRLGLAVWEEIPLYHYTPLTFGIALERGIPQQMLREMALRDMNHPAVLFHGLANESTGEAERTSALRTLHEIDREIDGTRLTGQAAYGFAPDDPTSEPLDVAAYTFYHGVFYGTDAAAGTRAALEVAHRRYPDKPIVVVEFGRWADGPDGFAQQTRIFEETADEVLARRADRPGGYVSGAVWWTLEDYLTLRPGIEVERFGLFRADGSRRPVTASVATRFLPIAADDPSASAAPIVSSGRGVPAGRADDTARFLGYLAYGALVTVGVLVILLGALVGRGGRSTAGRRA